MDSSAFFADARSTATTGACTRAHDHGGAMGRVPAKGGPRSPSWSPPSIVRLGALIVGSNNGGRKSTPSDPLPTPFRPLFDSSESADLQEKTLQGAGIELLWGRRSRPPRASASRSTATTGAFAHHHGGGLPGVRQGDDGPLLAVPRTGCRGKSVGVRDSRPLGSGMGLVCLRVARGGTIPSWVRHRVGAILGSFENGSRERGDTPSWDGTGDE
jgi:hypothetical protein